MRITLTHDEARRLEAARAAVLVPAAAADEDGWGTAAAAVLARLVRASGVRLVLLRQGQHAARVYGDDLGEALRPCADAGGAGPCNRLWWRAAGRGAGAAATGRASADAALADLDVADGLYDAIGFTAEFGAPRTCARVVCQIAPARDAAETSRALRLLCMLLPSFAAAARARAFTAVPRETLSRLLDAMNTPALLCALPRGDALHANPPLARILAADPALRAELSRAAAASAAAREVSTPAARYRLRPSVLTAAAGGAATTLVVVVEPVPASAPRADQGVARADRLRERFGLTSREVEVTRLLALGMPNAGIAAALKISESTARHHTERVLDKLGARSRAAVPAIVHGPTPWTVDAR